jgi:predicted RNA-binding protein
MTKGPVSILVSLALFVLIIIALPYSAMGEQATPKKTPVKEYRLGEILIKGEREKPQVYFIIPKAKFSLQNIAIGDDSIWELKETEIQTDQ